MKNLILVLLCAATYVVATLLAQTMIVAPQQVRGPVPINTGFVDGEMPAGPVNGINLVFTLVKAPNPPTSLHLYRNGLRQYHLKTYDYTLNGNVINFMPPSTPLPGDLLVADYRY